MLTLLIIKMSIHFISKILSLLVRARLGPMTALATEQEVRPRYLDEAIFDAQMKRLHGRSIDARPVDDESGFDERNLAGEELLELRHQRFVLGMLL